MWRLKASRTFPRLKSDPKAEGRRKPLGKALFVRECRDLVLYFRHQLRVKIRCDRKHLACITLKKRWVNAVSLVVRKGAMLESSFPPLPAHGVYGTGRLGPHPE